MYKRILSLILASLVLAAGLSPVEAWPAVQPTATMTPIPTPTAPPTVTPTVTPVVVEVRQPPQPPQSFWERYGVTALLVSGVIGGVLALIFQNLLGPTFAEWGQSLNEWRKGAAGCFRERYIPALAEEHHSLKLVGVHGREEVSPPRLKEVYVSLQMGSVEAADGALRPGLTIEQAFSQGTRLLILGEPGAGKSTLLDYLCLVFCGEIEAPRLTGPGELRRSTSACASARPTTAPCAP